MIKIYFTHSSHPLSIFRALRTSGRYVSALMLLAYLLVANNANAQTGCSPVSTLPCTSLKVSMPFNLNFNAGVASTIVDKNNVGTGFTTVNTYSGSRVSADGTPSNASVPGYEPSKITVSGGQLLVAASKGIDFTTNNNQLNTLGVKINPVKKFQIETKIVNPYNGSQSQQAGIWYGLSDKTYIKLGISANKVEMRKEVNDVSSTSSLSSNPDQRITGTISGLNTQTVYLRMVIDSAANTVEGFYSTDGTNYISAGSSNPTTTLDISGTGLLSGEVFTGLFSTYRNGSSSVTYTFDDFAITNLAVVTPPAPTGCSPISTLPCESLKVNMPFTLNFDAGVNATVLDNNNVGTGFTMVNTYSGTRVSADGTPSNANVPGYEPSKITVSGGRLMVAASKGIDFTTNNNQLNTLGVKITPTKKYQIEVKLINPYNAAQSQQAGIWYGLNDKTYIKLGISANKVEMRKETNDVSSSTSGTGNPDQRITAAISGLNNQTVFLRMVIDSAAKTVEGFYSTNGVNYVSAGASYPTSTLDISSTGLTTSDGYAGLFSTYRNGSTSVTYTFDDFAITSLGQVAFQPINIDFQPASATVPDGYIADIGQSFDATRGFGWISPSTGAPADLRANTRLRTGNLDQRLLSIIQMQVTTSGQREGTWEYVLPNGFYRVTVSAGDNGFYDSNHLLNVEGVPVISDFTASAQEKYRSGIGYVQVLDGKLTVSAVGGYNTKMTYLIIDKATPVADAIAPVASARIVGTMEGGAYADQAQVFIKATDEGGSGIAKIQYSINNGAYTNYTQPLNFFLAGNYSVKVKATDGNNNETITGDYNFSVVVKPQTGVYMVLKNMDDFPANDQLVFSRLQNPWRRTSPDTTAFNANHDLVKLRINSKGTGKLLLNSLSLSNPGSWKIVSVNSDTTSTLPVLVNPGAYAEVTIQFIAKNLVPRVVIFADTLTIASNDSLTPVKKVMLRGVWQKNGEGNSEPYAQEIVTAFGFKSVIGYGHDDGSVNGRTIVPNSSEIAANYFVKADPSKPVTVYQMAAYHSCCAATETFKYFPKGSTAMTTVFTHLNLDGQSLLPRLRGTSATTAQGTFEPTGSFGLQVGTASSDRTQNFNGLIGMRIVRVYDSNGNIVPNAYFINGDYLGTSFTNYDYQDNIYYIDNIRPETGSPYYSELVASSGSAVTFNPTLTGASSAATVTLKNNGLQYSSSSSDPAITLTGVAITGPNAGDFQVGALATNNLAVQATTPLSVTFNPGSLGIKNAILLVYYNNAVSPLRIPLYGIANSSGSTISISKRIKSGANASMTVGGNVYEADNTYRKGSIKLDTQTPISNIGLTDLDSLYQSYLSAAADQAETSYEIPLSNGNYQVRLHFVENYFMAPGMRVFNVSIENQKMLSNLDIFAATGYRNVLVKDFSTTVNDGVLNIKFNPTVNRVAVAAVEIFKVTNNAARIAVTEEEVPVSDAGLTEVSVYPNPSDGKSIQVNAANFGKNETVSIIVRDNMGRKVHTGRLDTDNGGSGTLSIQFGRTLGKGIYILSAESDTQKISHKFLVQ